MSNVYLDCMQWLKPPAAVICIMDLDMHHIVAMLVLPQLVRPAAHCQCPLSFKAQRLACRWHRHACMGVAFRIFSFSTQLFCMQVSHAWRHGIGIIMQLGS